ncbi:FCD domain-containing protein [Candidatus Poribacteria bacterium]|nr:FCD domain-containing protein [Candidatus Poribacteria bacterium]
MQGYKKTDIAQIKHVKRTSLVDDIVESLISYITEQKLTVGDKLPSERLLVKALGVSRIPLREALARLQALGIISVHHGKGAFISEFNALKILHKLSPILRCQSEVSLLDMLEARIVIECQVVAFAANRRSEEILKRLEADIHAMERDINDRLKFIKNDMDFHETIAEATENPVLVAFVAITHNLIQIVQESFPDLLEARQESLEYHKQIYSAIKERKPDYAEESMRNHLNNIAERLKEQKVSNLPNNNKISQNRSKSLS